MRHAGVRRCVNLISNSMATLPFPLLKKGPNGQRDKAVDHSLYDVLTARPNSYQTAFEFKRLMQRRLLIDGNAYAQILRARGRVIGLLPICPTKVAVKQRDDGTIEYKVRAKAGGSREIAAIDVLHLRGDSDDGILGVSLVDEAGDVLGLTMRAEEAAARLFRHGTMVGGALESDNRLGEAAFAHLRESLDDKFSGAENAHKVMILEEGLKFKPVASSARDAQNLESRNRQTEEIARLFGVPRPFLMMDDTSWGSGIEQLGIFFVQFTLAPWFKCWEEAVARALLDAAEVKAGYYPKFNERALLRGSMKDQGEFLAKLTGTGGGPQIIEQNEARAWLDLPKHPDGGGLSNGAMGSTDAGGD